MPVIEYPTYPSGHTIQQVDTASKSKGKGHSLRQQGRAPSPVDMDEQEEDDGEDENEERRDDDNDEDEDNEEEGSEGGSAPITQRDFKTHMKAMQDQNQVVLESMGRMISSLAKKVNSGHSSKPRSVRFQTGVNNSDDSEDEEMEDEPARGQSKKTSMPGLFHWVEPEVLQLVIRDALKPEQLSKLRNPDSLVVAEEEEDERPSAINGVPVEYKRSLAAKNEAFVRAVQNLGAFTQLFGAYAGIRTYYSDDPALGAALFQFMTRVVDLNAKYYWKEGVAPYIANTLRHRFGQGVSAKVWARDDQEAFNAHLVGNLRTDRKPVASSSSTPSKKKKMSTSNKAYEGSSTPKGGPCFRFNSGEQCSNCKRPHICLVCRGNHTMADCLGGKVSNDEEEEQKSSKKKKT